MQHLEEIENVSNVVVHGAFELEAVRVDLFIEVLTQDGHVSEGSAMNIFMVRNDTLITPSITENILEGITRRTAIELAREELGIQIIERPIDRTEIYMSDELFMTGTAAQIVAITRVDHRIIGTGQMGPIATQLRDLYQQAVRGKLTKYSHWNTPVYPA